MDQEFFIPEEKRKVNWIWVGFGVILLGVIIIFGWNYYVSKSAPLKQTAIIVANADQKDKSDEWKTYENIKYGFSIRIPDSFYSLKKEGCKPDKTIDPQASNLLLGSNCNENISLKITDLALNDWLKNHNTTGWAMKDVNIGQDSNLPAKSLIIAKDNPYEDFTSVYLFENNNYLFELAEKNNRLLLNEIINNLHFDYVTNLAVNKEDKKFTSNLLKFEFQYPSSWKTIVMRQIKFEPSVYDKGNAYSSSYKQGATEALTYDPEGVFDFSIYSKDYARFPFSSPFNPVKVDLNWTKDDFVLNMKPPMNVLGVKKLGSNGFLVILHNDIDCMAAFSATVYIPTNNADYPNFLINIDLTSVVADPLIKEYQEQQEKINRNLCSTTEPFQKITDQILIDNYSDKINNRLETARKIADSFKNL